MILGSVEILNNMDISLLYSSEEISNRLKIMGAIASLLALLEMPMEEDILLARRAYFNVRMVISTIGEETPENIRNKTVRLVRMFIEEEGWSDKPTLFDESEETLSNSPLGNEGEIPIKKISAEKRECFTDILLRKKMELDKSDKIFETCKDEKILSYYIPEGAAKISNPDRINYSIGRRPFSLLNPTNRLEERDEEILRKTYSSYMEYVDKKLKREVSNTSSSFSFPNKDSDSDTDSE